MTAPRPELLSRILDEAQVACLLREPGDGDDKGLWLASPGLDTLLGRPLSASAWATWTEADWRDSLHGEDSFNFLAALAQMDAGASFTGQSLRLRHANGDWRRCRCTGSLRDGVSLLIFTDTTAVQQVEAALLDSQMRLRGLYDATPVAILLWSREGRITDWNRMATVTFGHARDAVIGHKLAPLLIHPEEYGRFSESINVALRDNSPSRIPCRTLTASGDELLCEWHSVPMRSTKGNLIGIISLALDITAQAQAAASLRRSRDMAEQLSQAKSEFMATISHELRTPLNGILGMAQLLEMMELGGEEMEFVRVIVESGTLLLGIINAIVGYTEIDATRPEDCLEEFSFAEVLALAADRYDHVARQKGLTFDVAIDDGLMETLTGDRRAVEKIIANLLDNAIRFTDAGGIRLAARRELGGGGDAGVGTEAAVLIDVTDSGVGISPEFIEKHLYSPFKQAENAIVRKRGGVGLGLAVAKKLVDRLQGSIDVVSREGEGSTFSVRLPFRAPSPPAL